MRPELKLPDQSYRYLFENASDAMWVHDMKGNIVAANKACEELTGHSRQELVGANIDKFLTKEFLDSAKELRRRLLDGESLEQPYEQQLVRKDGVTRIIRMVTSPVIINGEMKGFQHIARDVTEERRLQENMRVFSQLCIQAQERERQRIALELHDDVVQALLLISQHLDMMASIPGAKLSKPVQEEIENLHTLSNDAIARLRRCAQDLRPRILDDLGLVAALEWMADDLIKSGRIDAHVHVLGIEQALSGDVQLLLFRIAQEALSNIRKHAGASHVWITIEFGNHRIILTVKDNGKGFKVPERIEDLAGLGRLGLAGMHERARLIGGTLGLKSEPGQGTIVTVAVPI